MGFLTYSEQAGLIVKNKATILEDLIDLCKQAYGPSFVLTEGTEMYTFLDVLSAALAEDGSATKAVYDAFSFIGAKGTPLDVLCSLAGISRQDGESDTTLRARYYKFLYTPSVGTVPGLEAKLYAPMGTVNQVDENGIVSSRSFYLVDDVYIKNNDTGGNVDFLAVNDLPGHSIGVVCKHNAFSSQYILTTDLFFIANKSYYTFNATTADFDSATVTPGNAVPPNTYYEINEKYEDYRTIISDTVKNYKALGCGVKQDTDQYNYFEASPEVISVTCTIHYTVADLAETQKDAIKNQLKTNIAAYVNNLKLGESITYFGLLSCVNSVYAQLNYTDYIFYIDPITVEGNPFTVQSAYEIAKNKYAYTVVENITINEPS